MKRKRLLLLLVLLMTAATGAWAQDAKHRITATLNSSSQTQPKTLDVTLPYETTIGEVYTAVTGKAPAFYLSLTAAEVKSGSNVSIGVFNEWNTPVTVSADGDATVEFTATLMGASSTNGTITLSVAPIYAVKLADGTQDAKNWTIASGDNSVKGDAADGLTGLSKGNAVTLTYGGHLKVKNVTATTDAKPAEEPVTLATPLTIEAVTPGTIKVNIFSYDSPTLSMKYSVNGGTKTTITESTDITVAKGDKVQFYGNGTSTKVYGSDPVVNIQGTGDGFQTKVYGNIMSLLDETGFATKTDLPNDEYVFNGLFQNNSTLTDASELLLPAAMLATACYQQMFESCTSLTKAPKLPATTLAPYCYYGMFFNCTSLTSAYVKAAYTEGYSECNYMFSACTATGATLHTTSGSKESWQDMMGSGKEWSNWSVAADWQD